nr:reverse transcriptase domain-containing protein [Tanacetum cinerariifolium]
MQTRSSSRLASDQSSNPTLSTNLNPKGRNCRRSKQWIENSNLEEQSHLIVTMIDNHTMAELLRAPTERYAEAIVIPLILAEQFKLKHSLINMMTTDKFFGLEKDNLHDHICWFNKITSTIKYKDMPSSTIKLMLFPFSLAGASHRWLEKEPPHSINMWEDLVSKFINEFFPPSRTTNLRNEISNFQQRFDESFHEAWDRYKDLPRACPHYGFTELHQLDTFYNALNPADQHSLNAAAEIPKLTHAVNQQTNAVTTAMTAILKQFQANPPPAPVKSVEETCVTCGGPHPYYQCLAAGGNTFPEFKDNIQGYVSAAAVNYNQGDLGYRPPGFNHGNEQSYQAPAPKNQNVHLNELEKVRRMNEANLKAMQTQIDMVKNDMRNEMKCSIQTSLSNQTNEIKNMMASLLQINTASTSGSGSLPSNTVANPKEEDERAEETFTNPDLAKYNIKVPPPPKKLGLPGLIPTYITLELANRAICTPAGIARDVFILVGKFTFPADFVIGDYKSDLRVPLIMGRHFLRTAHALINVHGEEMILRDGDERLTLNMRHDTSSYSNQPQKESINLINAFNNSSKDFLEDLFPYQPSGNPTFSLHPELTSPEFNNDIFDSEGCNVLSEKLLDLDSTKDIHPPLYDNPLSGNTTYPLLEEFADELPPKYDDNLHIIYGSPVLETLVLGSCYGFEVLDINDDSVRNFVICGYSSEMDTL